jgi:hypothetical protein
MDTSSSYISDILFALPRTSSLCFSESDLDYDYERPVSVSSVILLPETNPKMSDSIISVLRCASALRLPDLIQVNLTPHIAMDLVAPVSVLFLSSTAESTTCLSSPFSLHPFLSRKHVYGNVYADKYTRRHFHDMGCPR